MAGSYKFKDNSGNVVATISGSTSGITFSGSAVDFSNIQSINLGTMTISGGNFATTGSNTFKGTQTFSGSIVPVGSGSFDLGTPSNPFRHLYLSSASLYIDGQKVLGSTNQELQITTDTGQSIKILESGTDTITLQSADGDIQLKTSGGGNLLLDPTNGLIDLRGTVQIQDGNKITSSGGNSVVFNDDIIVSGSGNFTGGITVNGVNFSSMTSGTSGSNGTNGSSGTSGSNGTNGSSGSSGSNGTNGTSGSNGTNGTSGSNGTNGSSGSSGSNGTNVHQVLMEQMVRQVHQVILYLLKQVLYGLQLKMLRLQVPLRLKVQLPLTNFS